jgi:hypothetical protein
VHVAERLAQVAANVGPNQLQSLLARRIASWADSDLRCLLD